MIELSFIIVNYHTQQLLAACLASLVKIQALTFEIILVDIEGELPVNYLQIHSLPGQVLTLKNNPGFGTACNAGSKLARGTYLFFLNPDTKLLSKEGEILRALNFIRSNHQPLILGAKLFSAPMTIQPWCCGSAPTLLNLSKNNLGFFLKSPPWQATSTRPVDWVSGAAFLLKKETFAALGGFDEKFFMYFEDVDLCTRAKKSGFEVYFFPQLQILHYGGASFKNSQQKKRLYYQTQLLYFQKQRPRLEVRLLKILQRLFLK